MGTNQTVHEAIDQRLAESNIKLNQLGQIVQRYKEKLDKNFRDHHYSMGY